ncbi:MAG TPA: hypothetical protein VMJ10_19040, partial [Kofleriaceae bacterium]|nr:hypothetical protein [Kofleriaceae bacterium]
KAGLLVGFMAHGVSLLTNENKALPGENLNDYFAILATCTVLNKDIHLALRKLHDTWSAYQAGGAEALAEERELGLFEKVQHWIATGDPRAKSLHVAMDQEQNHIRFDGTTSADTEALGQVFYYCHSYTAQPGQAEEATLYVNDPRVAADLRAAGLILGDTTVAQDAARGSAGVAETQEDKRGGDKFTISISMAKALGSLGVRGTFTNAMVLFYYKGTYSSMVYSRHKGPWFENWKGTPEFEAFWRSTLGTNPAFIRNGHDDHEDIPGATTEERDASISIAMVGAP